MNAQRKPQLQLQLPRLGFLGMGWIGRQRMQALADSRTATIAVVADPDPEARRLALAQAPDAVSAAGLEELLAQGDLDGLVIATPSGAHAAQATAALERGLAVFCQKPLTRTAEEARVLLEVARRVDRRLEVDFSYRYVTGVRQLRELVAAGALGEIFAVDLVFHNAYGPDKPWFYDIAQSGGGCLMDLGIHLVDLARWVTGSGGHHDMQASLYRQGVAMARPIAQVEDYASAQWRMDNGANVRMACSWRLPAGCDAVIEASFYGTAGGASLRNVGGSFLDFSVERFDGTSRQRIAQPPDAWGGRALVAWSQALAEGGRYDPGAAQLLEVARTVDAIYGR